MNLFLLRQFIASKFCLCLQFTGSGCQVQVLSANACCGLARMFLEVIVLLCEALFCNKRFVVHPLEAGMRVLMCVC